MSEHYDIIIVGTGAGGGTLAHELALAGKKLLILERGPFLPREKENWDTTAVFLQNRYHTTETWTDHNGKTLHPGTGYWVGGNTKVFGAAMFRLRVKDFETLQHEGGISPQWPLKYDVFEPYYTWPKGSFASMARAASTQLIRPEVRNTPSRRFQMNAACRRFSKALPAWDTSRIRSRWG